MRRRSPESLPDTDGGPPSGDGRVLEITAAIANGDAAAFAVFYETWFDRAYTIARRITRRDESFCLDVVQDAMLRSVRSLPPMPDAASLGRWMSRVVETAAIDRLRREARRLRREEKRSRLFERSDPVDAASAAELEEEVAWLREELAGLPETERVLLSERFERGSTLQEAGASVGLTGNAAHGRIRRAIERLRKAAREVFGHER